MQAWGSEQVTAQDPVSFRRVAHTDHRAAQLLLVWGCPVLEERGGQADTEVAEMFCSGRGQ